MPPDAASPAVHAIDSASGLLALRPEWEALWASSPRATPFQHPAWLVAWWRHLGGGPLCLLAVRDGARLAGVWPMFVWHGAVRQLTPLGNGVSDHVDLLAAPGHESAVAGAVLAHLARSPGWDTADFRDLPADSPLLARELPRGIHAEVEDDEPCPALSLAARCENVLPAGGALPEAKERPGRPDVLEGLVPREFLKKLRYYRRRLDREFTVAWETAIDPSSLDTLFGGLVRLHAARWAGRGAAGMFGDPRVAAFHRDVAAAFLARGMLRLHGLRVDGELAAAWYGFSANRRTHYYLGGFDPARERHSIGTVMVGHAMEQAVREGSIEFGFLRGREAYKYAWGAVDRPQRRLRLTRRAAR